MNKSKALVFSILIMISGPVAQADDLLSILNSETSDGLIKEKNDLTESIRKTLGKVSAEQNIFLGFLENDQFDKAMYQFRGAFEGTPFAKSPSGQALEAYLLYKNGLAINSLEKLFQIKEPQKIGPEIKKIWNLSLPTESDFWARLKVEWSPAWTAFFGTEIEGKVVSWQVDDPTQTDRILELISKTKLSTDERHWLEWQMALGLALKDDTTKAGKVLAHMLKSGQELISHDLINMTAARLLYENGYLSPAIEYYKKVGKSSEYWFEAQEEIAWAYIRKGEPQNTLAITQSLIVPSFSGHVGPESIFLRSLAQLKVCNYPEVVKSINDYSHRYRPRAERLLKLVENTQNESTNFFIETAKMHGRVSPLELGPHADQLPRYLSRDEVAYILIRQMQALENEAKLAGNIYARSLSDGTDKVGFQGQFEELKKHTEARVQASRGVILARIRLLAEAELEEINHILQKMHIVEAEVIQQISLAQKVTEATRGTASVKSGSTGSKAVHSMRFPFQGEVWFDEINNYNVDIRKGCQATNS